MVEVIDARTATVGEMAVRRALPTRGHRTVGVWCFADHYGPQVIDAHHPPDIGPHPHLGLQTVTWLLEGELVHRDSLGSEQLIRPGQLNLMTAGHGVAHAEESPGTPHGSIHGMQLWVAQPEATRDGPAAFEHHGQLPEAELDGATATVLVGTLAGATSPVRRDTDHVGADLVLRAGRTVVPLDPGHEHALVVTVGAAGVVGAVGVDGPAVGPGQLLYLEPGRHELVLESAEPSRALLLGGTPFPETLVMWWNFVARTRDEVDAAHRDWADDTGRFGTVASDLARIPTDPPPWARPSS